MDSLKIFPAARFFRSGRGVSVSLLMASLFTLVVTGCQGPPPAVQIEAGLPIPPEGRVVSQRPNPAPAWLDSLSWSDQDFKYFVGVAEDMDKPQQAHLKAYSVAAGMIARSVFTVVKSQGIKLTGVESSAMIRADEQGRYDLRFQDTSGRLRCSAGVLLRFPQAEYEMARHVADIWKPGDEVSRETVLEAFTRLRVIEIQGPGRDAYALQELLCLVDPETELITRSLPSGGVRVLLRSAENVRAYVDFFQLCLNDGLITDLEFQDRLFRMKVVPGVGEQLEGFHPCGAGWDELKNLLAAPTPGLTDLLQPMILARLESAMAGERAEPGLEALETALDNGAPGIAQVLAAQLVDQAHTKNWSGCEDHLSRLLALAPNVAGLSLSEKGDLVLGVLKMTLYADRCGLTIRSHGSVMWLKLNDSMRYEEWSEVSGWSALESIEADLQECRHDRALGAYNHELSNLWERNPESRHCLLSRSLLCIELFLGKESDPALAESNPEIMALYSLLRALVAGQTSAWGMDLEAVQTLPTPGLGKMALAWLQAGRGNRDQALELLSRALQEFHSEGQQLLSPLEIRLFKEIQAHVAIELGLDCLAVRILRELDSGCGQPALWHRRDFPRLISERAGFHSPEIKVRAMRSGTRGHMVQLELEIEDPAGIDEVVVLNRTNGDSCRKSPAGKYKVSWLPELNYSRNWDIVAIALNGKVLDLFVVDVEGENR
jgi:hypothetical protein